MMGGYWYMGPAPDGRRFCYAKTPTFTCPIASAAQGFLRDATLGSDPLAERVFDAASALRVDPKWLAQRVSSGSHHRERVDGKLTDRCTCGARMDRLGFAIWVEREAPERTDTSARFTREVFGGQPVERVGRTRYADTKREAQTWARQELAAAKAADE